MKVTVTKRNFLKREKIQTCAKTTHNNLGLEVRCLQQKCKLSQLQTDCVVKLLKKRGCGPINLNSTDKKMQAEAGIMKVELHGCTHVDEENGDHCQHVYGPEDERRECPKCGHPRYAENGTTPNEKIYWFPLQPRLEALFRLPSYRKLLQVLL